MPNDIALAIQLESWEKFQQNHTKLLPESVQVFKGLEASKIITADYENLLQYAQSEAKLTHALKNNTLAVGLSLHPSDGNHPVFLMWQPEGFQLQDWLDNLIMTGKKVKKYNNKGHDVFEITTANGKKTCVGQNGKILIFSTLSWMIEESLAVTTTSLKRAWNNNFVKTTASTATTPMCLYISGDAFGKRLQEWLRPEYQTLGNAVQSSISTLAMQWMEDGCKVKLESPHQSTAFDIIQQTSPAPSTSIETVLPDNTSFALQMQWKPRQWQYLLFSGADANEFHHFLEAWSDYRFAIAVGEPLSGDLSDDCTMAFGVQNEAALQKILQKAGAPSSYQSFQIYRLAEAGPLKALFQKLHNNPKHIAPNLYSAVLGKWLVVATQLSSLEIMIDKYIVGQVMAQSADYLLAKPQGNEQQQSVLMWNNKQLPNILDALYQEPLSSQTRRAFQQSGWVSVQKQQSSGNQSNWLPGFQKGSTTNLTPQYVWKTPFDAPLVSSPQIATLDDSTHLILIQDALHKLHCTNTNGQTLWTKALDGPLLSKVHLITPFESRKPALLFNTAGNIYLLEATQGEPIGGFPIHLRSPAANGLIPVFFEGKNENAFFLSNQNGFLYGYDQLGRPFEGWNAQHNTGKVTQPLVHYRYQSKDYIVAVNDQGIISTYGKFGEVRLPLIASELSPSAPVMLDTSGAVPRIIFTDLKGQGVVCNAKGEVFRMPLGISAAPKTTKVVLTNYAGDARLDYVILQGKTLQIKAYQADNTLKTVLKHSFLEEQTDLFLPNNISASSGLVGTLARGTGQISLVRKGKGALGGFPLAGTTPFALIRLQPEKYLLVVGDGASLNAYRIAN